MKNRLSILLFIFSINLIFAQQKDTVRIENQRFDFKNKNIYIPAALVVSGVIASGHAKKSWDAEVVEARNKHFFGFENHLDDYMQFFPWVAIYGFEIAGMTPRTDYKNRTAIFLKGQILNLGMVYILKNATKATRPDGTALSFPSGHTANVFAGATMLCIEYGENHKWVPYLAYSAATSVGVMRIVNNKHYISDVLVGAGLGILSMKIAYWTHQYKWNQPKSDTDPFAGIIY